MNHRKIRTHPASWQVLTITGRLMPADLCPSTLHQGLRALPEWNGGVRLDSPQQAVSVTDNADSGRLVRP